MSKEKVVELDEARKAKALPEPVGYRLLIAIPEKEEKKLTAAYCCPKTCESAKKPQAWSVWF